MSELFGSQTKFSTWRKLWLELAKAQKKLGLDITQVQINQMSKHLNDIDFEKAAPVDLGCVIQFDRYGHEKLAQHKDVKGAAPQVLRDDQGFVGVQPVQAAKEQVNRNQGYDVRKHHGGQEHDEH